MRRRGAFFTLGLTLFAFVLLSLAIVASTHFGTYDDRFIDLISFNRLGDLSSSLEDSLKKIFELSSGITLGVASNQAVFTQELPLNFSAFNSSMAGFESFAESNDNNIELDIGEIRKNLPLHIHPHNIRYIQNISENYILIIPASNNINGYSVMIDLGEESNITSCGSTTNAGLTSLSIDVVSANGSTCSLNTSVNLSLYNNLTANDITVATTPDGGLKVSSPSTAVTATTSITLKDISDDATEIRYPDNIYRVDLAALSLSKSGTAKLA